MYRSLVGNYCVVVMDYGSTYHGRVSSAEGKFLWFTHGHAVLKSSIDSVRTLDGDPSIWLS